MKTRLMSRTKTIRTGAAALAACVVVGVVGVVVAGPALAHHSFGQFDMQRTVTVQGTVRQFQWANPHVWIDLMVIDPATRRATPFSVEADSVSLLTRKGWTRNSLHAGDRVSMVIHPLKNGQVGGSLVSASVNGAPIGVAQVAH